MPLIFKKLSLDDYHKNYLNLLNLQDISFEKFEKFFLNINSNTTIYVIEYNNKIIGTMTFRIEYKLTEKISYINDLFIDPNYSSKKIDDKLIGLAIYKSHKKKCNKIILTYEDKDIDFLENKGFQKDNTNLYYFKLD
jgi:N-acetylglutamate synthase-like GNAT family acetyltransferase